MYIVAVWLKSEFYAIKSYNLLLIRNYTKNKLSLILFKSPGVDRSYNLLLT